MIITAEEARKIGSPLRDAYLARLDKLIREAAAGGKSSIRVPDDMVKTTQFHAAFGTAGVHEALTEAGYKVTVGVAERQFVDVWIEVSW